ncbi:transposase (fragment) [Planktothrix sp. PCC 11201]
MVVLDQSSIHTSDRFLSKLSEWEQKNLKIFWLPTYSPKLNLIEILWKFIKYEWIEVDAYASWSSLIKYLKKVLENLGQEYAINFV